MESYAEVVGIMEKPDVGLYNTGSSSHSSSTNAPIVPLFDQFLFFIKASVEYSFGMHMGFAVGWLLGWCTGNVYAKHFEPVYLDNLSELSHWRLIPYEFARNGAIVGVLAGAIVIAIINSNLFSRRVVSLYEKRVTDPKDVAPLLGKSVQQIKKKINKLTEKGEIIC